MTAKAQLIDAISSIGEREAREILDFARDWELIEPDPNDRYAKYADITTEEALANLDRIQEHSRQIGMDNITMEEIDAMIREIRAERKLGEAG
ncbi:MAG: hypothetical protein LBE35_06830, partial [Clostridiales bacterium]|nr:hypothetical protein [Clostridiales bacterium]